MTTLSFDMVVRRRWRGRLRQRPSVFQHDANAAGPVTQVHASNGDLGIVGRFQVAEIAQIESQSYALVQKANRSAAEVVAEEAGVDRKRKRAHRCGVACRRADATQRGNGLNPYSFQLRGVVSTRLPMMASVRLSTTVTGGSPLSPSGGLGFWKKPGV